MKKSFPANINGRIYNIDEDAFTLLKNYLDQLHATFPGEEGCEIVTDIEARVAELFDEHVDNGNMVITIADVNNVIAIVGSPEDLGENDCREDACCNNAKEQCESMPPPFIPEDKPVHKLYRDIDNKMLGGVLSGIAMYFGNDPNLIRVLMVVLTICTAFWPCFIAYLITWAVIPPANTPRRKLELRGEAVSVEAVGRNVLTNEIPERQSNSGFGGFLNAIAKCAMAFVGLMAGCTGLAMLVSLLCLIGILIAMPFNQSLSFAFYNYFPGGQLTLVIALGILSCMLVILPCIALFWLALYVIFNVKGCGTSFAVSALVMEIILFVAVVVLSLILGSNYGMWWWQIL